MSINIVIRRMILVQYLDHFYLISNSLLRQNQLIHAWSIQPLNPS